MKKTLDLMVAGIMIIIFVSILLIEIFYIKDFYKMEIYVRKPDNSRLKLTDCWSFIPNFKCNAFFYDCSKDGTYFGKAVTYRGDTILSSTGWAVLPYLCRRI